MADTDRDSRALAGTDPTVDPTPKVDRTIDVVGVEGDDATVARTDPTVGTGIVERERPIRIGAWLGLVAGLALAAVFIPVPARTYDLNFRRQAIPDVQRIDLFEIWDAQVENLPDVRFDGAFAAMYVLAIVVFLLGVVALLWFAVVEVGPAAVDESADLPPNDAVGHGAA